MDPAIEASSIETSRKIFGWNTIDVEFPSHPTVEHSLQVRRVKDGNFCQSKVYEYSLMFFGLRAITQFWEEELVATQYLVYAKQEFEKDGSAKVFAGWEIIPYKTIENTTPSENKGFAFFHKIVNSIRRIWQQCVVFYRIVFGALASSERELSAKKTFYSKLKEDFEELIDKSLIKTSNLNQDRTDAFCQQEVRDKQRVWKGQYGDGLVSYAPVGLGGERIHLLYVPDDHGDFDTLSENAYIEAMHFHNESIKVIVENRKGTDRAIQNVYMMHKKGHDAGQTVMGHWHSQCIMTSAATQDTLSKLQVLWNIVFGSSKLQGKALDDYVDKFHGELSGISQLVQDDF